MNQLSRSCGSHLALSELEKALNFAATVPDGALSPESADCTGSALFEIGDLPDLTSGNLDEGIAHSAAHGSHGLQM